MNKTALITGANRGIGLALTKLYSSKGYSVIAACRTASEQLIALSKNTTVRVVDKIDIADSKSIEVLKREVEQTKIELLINNAGILRDEVLGSINYDSIQWQFNVNTLGALRVTECFESNLNSGAKVAMITSRMGSMGDNTSGGRYGYRMSKAALNAASVSLAHDLKPKGIALAVIHPGLVGTDMIGGYGDVTPDQAAANIAQRIQSLSIANTGTFWHANGEVLPW